MQEVDEPGPNFIVVYDLQSGTLFKKWKPGVDCVALDISSKDGCVLSGHKNGQICIWDLTTGNCRWTLGGHVAPVTNLRLDPAGGSFVSLDTHTRDQTIKLWNINTGKPSIWLRFIRLHGFLAKTGEINRFASYGNRPSVSRYFMLAFFRRTTHLGVHADQSDNGVRNTAGRPARGGRVFGFRVPDQPPVARRPGRSGDRYPRGVHRGTVRRRDDGARGGPVRGLPGRRHARRP